MLKMKIMKSLNHNVSALCLLCCLAAAFSASAQSDALFSLKNLERERAALLATFTDESLSSDVRQQKVATIYKRLVDIERMVLRDERITNSDKLLVQKAFANYDLTFLVHASAEKNTQPLTQWMNTLGINANTIAQSTLGYR
jgi:hypothetical protein